MTGQRKPLRQKEANFEWQVIGKYGVGDKIVESEKVPGQTT